ncbi:MAG: glycosyltransferase family 4 protein [Solirubrobacteraceae bacterium]
MHVHVLDPSAYTPPYDHALCHALGQAGADVDLFTSHFSYGQVAQPDSYTRHEFFYRRSHRWTARQRRSRAGMATKLIEHVPDMLRYRRSAQGAGIVHFQWLTVQPIDIWLLPKDRPLVLTAHDVLPREPRPGQLAAQRKLYERMDAIVVHSQHGHERLVGHLGCEQDRVHVIPHGVLRPWEGHAEQPLPAQLREADGPVVLFFGLLRPYKGLDVLLEAWRGIEDAELWIVGMPRMDTSQLRATAPLNVRFIESYIPDGQIPAFMDRASFVVLPYLEIDQSGALFTALGRGTPVLLSDAGGFPELADTGAARIVPRGDSAALHDALRNLLDDEAALTKMCVKARVASEEAYSWQAIAQAHIELYERLLR